MPHDVSTRSRELIRRGLEDYARGRFREAVLAWQDAAALAPADPRAGSLLAFARKRINERDTPQGTRTRRETLASPIPGYLASLTAVEADEYAVFQTTVDGDEWAQVETRRVLGGMADLAVPEAVPDEQDSSDAWREMPTQNDRLQAGTRGLLDECDTALKDGRAETAALAAELVLQSGGGVGDSTLLLFERAFCACIGNMRWAPIRAVPPEELATQGFDHRASFLMSRMDGLLSVDDLIDVAGMPRFEALRLLAALRRAQAVDMVPL